MAKKIKDKELLHELYSLSENERNERFAAHLTFGTGGLRGIVGVGTNCMNIYTVARASKGIAAYMHKYGMKKTAISYDSRKNSYLFAQTAACVFAAEDITKSLFGFLYRAFFYLCAYEHLLFSFRFSNKKR